MLARFNGSNPLEGVSPVADGPTTLELQECVQQVFVEPALSKYMVQLVQAARSHVDLALRASPRATMGLYRCSQALAAVKGRDFVTPDEIKRLASFALRHRIVLKSQAKLRERTPDDVIAEILS